MTYTIGVIDTSFARVDMAKEAIEIITQHLPRARIIRYTVPGIKDIPIACKKVLEEADIAISLGWVGRSLIDKYSYLAASIGLTFVQILTGKHVIDVTVHEEEADSEKELYRIAVNRAQKHALNLVILLTMGREGLTPYAGTGLRQGHPDAGPIKG
jgi:riboflavin synthase